MRPQVERVLAVAPLSAADEEDDEKLAELEAAVDALPEPLTDDEARELVRALGPGEAYGIHWSLVHKLETAPGWPVAGALDDDSNPWVRRLRDRAANAHRRDADA